MLNDEQIIEVLQQALTEDAPWGDITSEALIPDDARATASLVTRESGVMAGSRVIELVFELIGDCDAHVFAEDGQWFDEDVTLAEITGSARSILRVERVALNVLQRMCGVATLTRQYVEAVEGTSARIVDTRKTTPCLRAFEKHAVICGGGYNHRFSLSDAVLVKDNHLAAASGDIADALRQVRESVSHTTHIEVEVDVLEQIEPVLASGVVDSIMLDNFSIADLRSGIALINGRALVEASGGVNLDTVRAIASTGVDVISVGALTHSARAIDLGLDIKQVVL